MLVAFAYMCLKGVLSEDFGANKDKRIEFAPNM
jgi:hypothetical protein